MTRGKDLRRAREAAGLTQVQAAERIGVKQATISDWENGKTEPGWSHLERIEGVYRVALREGQALVAFDRGFAAGEFSALAAMADAIAERARGAVVRLTPMPGAEKGNAALDTPPLGSAGGSGQNARRKGGGR